MIVYIYKYLLSHHIQNVCIHNLQNKKQKKTSKNQNANFLKSCSCKKV